MTAGAAAAVAEQVKDTPRICDLVQEKDGQPWIAFEFFPPKTETGVANLYKRLERMSLQKPLYIDFTWGAGGSTSDLTLELTQQSQDRYGFVANMHLTCTNMPRAKLDHALEVAQSVGIRNILALRGDPPAGQTEFQKIETGFSCSLDLIKFIRKETGDYFCVSAACYPEGHPDRIKKVIANQSLTPTELARAVTLDDGSIAVCSDIDFEEELAYLKEKVDAGAQMLVSQMFYDVDVFLTFVKQCREYGINVPIIPGLMCMTSYGGYKRMRGFCKTRVTKEMSDAIEAIKDDAEAFENFAVEWGVKTCRKLMANGINGLHFYTLNLDKVCFRILEELGLAQSSEE